MPLSLDERWRTRELSHSLEAVWRAHRADAVPGIEVQALAEVDSTNTRLLEASRNDAAPHLRLMVAQAQTAGRGRLGRAWQTTAGASLAFSLAVPIAPEAASSLVVGAAVADALEPPDSINNDQPRVTLKWPNDVWLRDPSSPFGGRKLGGILLETAATPAGRVLVVGIGLNLRVVTPLLFPHPAPVYGVAALDEVDTGIDGPRLLSRVAPAVLAALLRREADAAWRESWARRDLLAGRRIEAGTAHQHLTGIARGIDDDGALRVQRDDGGQIVAISSGEVSVRPLPG